jgi:Flp pilus assembly protein TadG
VIALLDALIAIPKIAALVEQLCATISFWWLSRQKAANLSAIVDAAAMTARAQTHEERNKALDAWRAALSRPRILP